MDRSNPAIVDSNWTPDWINVRVPFAVLSCLSRAARQTDSLRGTLLNICDHYRFRELSLIAEELIFGS